MWGYLEPGGLKQSVSVASSGNTDLASLPNTAVGLQQAYITLRNKYAPNVILAGHVSTWSWNTSTNCSLNVASIAGPEAASFQVAYEQCRRQRHSSLLVEPDGRQVLIDIMARADLPALHVRPVRDDPVVPGRLQHMRLGIEHV